MIASIFVVLSGVTVAFLQGKLLWKQNKKKDVFAFASILMIGVVLYAAYLLEYPFPTLYDVFLAWLGPVNKPITAWIKGD